MNTEVFLDHEAVTVQPALVVAGEMHHRFPESLAGNGAGVGADPTHHRLLFHDRDPFAELGRLNRGPLPAGAGADHQQVVGMRLTLG